MEFKGQQNELWQNHDASTGAAAVGKKGTSLDKATLNSKEIKPVAMAIFKLHLSEGIREGVSQSVIQQKN